MGGGGRLLGLVHPVCHDKSGHEDAKCDPGQSINEIKNTFGSISYTNDTILFTFTKMLQFTCARCKRDPV